ncbi:MAG: AEC family transporter [Candidatus Omnitrophota bacterium]
MNQMLDIAAIVLPVFIVMFLGNILRRAGMIDDGFIYQSNRLVFNISLPMLLFYKIGTADFTTNFNGALLFGSALAILIGFGGSYAYAVIRHYPPAARGVFCQGAFRGNYAIIGLAVVLNAYGEAGLTRAGIFMGFIVPWLNFLAILALLAPHCDNGSPGLGYWTRQIAANPLIGASFAGIFWSWLRLPIPVVLDRSMNIVTDLTLPLALLAIGAGFSLKNLKGDLKRATLASVIKVALLPILAGFILYAFGVRGLDFSVGILMVGSPAATVSYIMASQMKGDAELAGSIIILSTLFSIFTYSLTLYLLHVIGF